MGKRKHTDSDLVGLESLGGSDDGAKKGLFKKVTGVPVALVKTPLVVVTRLVKGIVHALGEVLKLPVRVIGGLARPWKGKKSDSDGE
ncbi:MAG: hypothetical protein RIE08_01380 [Acidimicrobiales bacterium]